MFGKNFGRFLLFFFFFQEKSFIHLQIVTLGDNLHDLGEHLHEVSNPIFWKKIKLLSDEIYTQDAKY